MIEERSATVTLAIHVTTTIYFSPIERERPITNLDAIENAVGSLPHGWAESLEGEGWEIAYPIEGEVHPPTESEN